MSKILSSEITPEHVYRSRRQFMRSTGALLAGALVLGACGQEAAPVGPSGTNSGAGQSGSGASQGGSGAAASNDTPTPYETITNYNNYYEFSTDKESVAALAQNFHTTPWAVEVGGLVNK